MKRRSMRIVCLAIAMVLLMASAVPAFAGKRITQSIRMFFSEDKDARLNVHGTPGVDNVIDHIDTSTVVDVLENVNGWAHIRWVKGKNNHGDGYVDSSYLSELKANGTTLYTSVCDVYMHSQSKIRQGECWKYHTGEMLKKGVKVAVLEQDGTWSLINYNGSKGWVPSIYLKAVK